MFTYRKLATAAVLLPLTIAVVPHALAAPVPGPIKIDPNGDGAGPTFTVDALDWNQTSILAVNAVNPTGGPGGTPALNSTFRALTQAQLGNFQLGGNNLSGTGLGGFEWTVVFAFQENVTGTSGGGTFATFVADPTKPSNLEIYYDPTPDADQLNGTGFAGGGGAVKILTATLNPLSTTPGNFTVTGGPVLMDQSGNGDQWSGKQTIVGGGGQVGNLAFDVTSFNSNFFVGGIKVLDLRIANASQILPFIQVDPSKSVWDAVAGVLVPSNVGAINLANGPDNLFQTDYNSSVRGVPEPDSLALMGLGIVAFGAGAIRRRGSKKAA